MSKSDLIVVEFARVFATAAHAAIDQRRKYTNDPYIVHPQPCCSYSPAIAKDYS